jgi:hypothetical protein
MRTSRLIYIAALLAGIVAANGTAGAEPDDLTITAPAPRDDSARGSGREHDPPTRDIPYAHIFRWPLTPEADMGLAIWTVPNAPVGPSGTGAREIEGWLGLGFIWTWGAHH